MTEKHGARREIPVADAGGLLVRDAMVARPKTLPLTATVADVRRTFENPRIREALLVEGVTFGGIVAREALPAGAPDEEAALGYAEQHPDWIGPDAPLADALALLAGRPGRRLVVLDADATTLCGLLCLDGTATALCAG